MVIKKLPITVAELHEWLQGDDPAMSVMGGLYTDALIKFPVAEGVEYIYIQSAPGTMICDRRGNFRFCGIYLRDSDQIYNGKFSMELVRDWVEDHERTETALLGDFNAAVRLRMEEIVAENREKYAAQVLTSSRLKAELEHYREYESREDAARRLLIASDPANIRFKAHFEHRKWGDELIRYLKDRDGAVEEAARDYIAHGGEEILLDFLKADILRERYIELLKDPSDPAYTVKAVSDAVEKSHAKYVKVTISKGGPEVTVVTEAAGFVGYHSYYDPGCLLPADKEAFEQAFGKYADYTAQDIVRITRGTKTIYEAPKGGE